jgi:hypothetical protein
MYTIYSMPGMSTLSWGIYESWTRILYSLRANMYLNFYFIFRIIHYSLHGNNIFKFTKFTNCSIISLLYFTKLTIMFGVEMDF